MKTQTKYLINKAEWKTEEELKTLIKKKGVIHVEDAIKELKAFYKDDEKKNPNNTWEFWINNILIQMKESKKKEK